MNKPNPQVQAFVTIVGGRKEAAAKLGVTVAMVGHLVNGVRDVSPQMALKVEQASNGVITRAALLPELFGPAASNRAA